MNRDQDKFPHQKIKIYSSNKRKKDNSSNKSSPAVANNSSERQKQAQKQTEDVKTNPFTTVDTPVTVKEENQKTEP